MALPRTLATLLASAVLCAGLAYVPAPAGAATSAPLGPIASHTFAEAGWVAFTFHTDGQWVRVAARTDTGTFDNWAGIYVFDENDNYVTNFAFGQGPDGTGVSVEARTEPTGTLVDTQALWTDESYFCDERCHLGVTMELNNPAFMRSCGSFLAPRPCTPIVGTFKVVLFFAGELESWTGTLQGQPGVTTGAAVTTGTGAWLYHSGDFEGDANVQVRTLSSYNNYGPYGHVVYNASIPGTLRVENLLLGFLIASTTAALAVEGPQDDATTCSSTEYPAAGVTGRYNQCYWYRAKGATNHGAAGDYTFKADLSVNAFYAHTPEIHLVGIDVRLPPV